MVPVYVISLFLSNLSCLYQRTTYKTWKKDFYRLVNRAAAKDMEEELVGVSELTAVGIGYGVFRSAWAKVMSVLTCKPIEFSLLSLLPLTLLILLSIPFLLSIMSAIINSSSIIETNTPVGVEFRQVSKQRIPRSSFALRNPLHEIFSVPIVAWISVQYLVWRDCHPATFVFELAACTIL